LTAENADISIGSVGSGAKKNTAFARTGIGSEIIEDAAKKGYLEIEPYNAINLNAVLFLAKLKKVSKYNIQKRKVFIVREPSKIDEPKVQTKPEEDQAVLKPLGSRKFLSVSKDIDENEKILKISVTNSVGYILEDIKIRIVIVEELFEKKPWITTIRELFPFETIEIGYPLETVDSEIVYGNVLVEVSTEKYGKVFSRTFKLAPNEEK
jgi:hypothetical protein